MDMKVITPPRDWRETLFLPQTDFAMKAGLPALETRLLARWAEPRYDGKPLYDRLRTERAGREKFILHDGPPYANGHIHIGHTLNKTLKDMVVRSRSMAGLDAPYVPGFDCHGLPIEWKIEEELRAAGKAKGDIAKSEFRARCRDFAAKWIGMQTEEFQRLGVMGAWDRPYLTMDYAAEATIAAELCKFAMNGTLYRGSKPVMWSVVEGTALAEAEVEYKDIVSPAIYVKFPVVSRLSALLTQNSQTAEALSKLPPPGAAIALEDELAEMRASIVIWTTTPWTIPANRALALSPHIIYAAYRVDAVNNESGAVPGETLILTQSLADKVLHDIGVTAHTRCREFSGGELTRGHLTRENPHPFPIACQHPLVGVNKSYGDWNVRLYPGDFVSDGTGTGFVHIAPGHGQDDYALYVANREFFAEDGIYSLPHTVAPDGRYYGPDAIDGGVSMFGELPVQDERGRFGKFDDTGYGNGAVIAALREAGALLGEPAKYMHSYPHSWRSKAPVIFRNTPQWFISLDAATKTLPGRRHGDAQSAIRPNALAAMDATAFTPEAGRRRLTGFIQNRPDWVVSRQRAWGVPITVLMHRNTGLILPGALAGAGYGRPDIGEPANCVEDSGLLGSLTDISAELIARIDAAFRAEGADAWFADGAKERFLLGASPSSKAPDAWAGQPLVENADDWEMVTDILDVWFDSGCTHAFVLESGRWPELMRPGATPDVPPTEPPADLYLEGSDQHRGWFQSSLLESVGTRGRAPYKGVLTHGFILDEKGEEKMSKSKGNALSPMQIAQTQGAEILRLWVASSDYTGDIRFGPGLLAASTESYRRIRNTLRFLLGNLAHHDGDAPAPEIESWLERWLCHRLAQVDGEVRAAYDAYDFPRVFRTLMEFCTNDLSATYFDIRKDTLYCEPASSPLRRQTLWVLNATLERLLRWLAPIMVFTAEEAWLARHGEGSSVHLQTFAPPLPDVAEAENAETVWRCRRVMTGALEKARAAKLIGSSLEAALTIYFADPEDDGAFSFASDPRFDWGELTITSAATIVQGDGPADAFRLPDVGGVAVVVTRAPGVKCLRSWRYFDPATALPEYPELSPRDGLAVREFDRRQTEDAAQ